MNGIPLQGILVPIRKWRNRNSFAPTRVPVVLFVFFSFFVFSVGIRLSRGHGWHSLSSRRVIQRKLWTGETKWFTAVYALCFVWPLFTHTFDCVWRSSNVWTVCRSKQRDSIPFDRRLPSNWDFIPFWMAVLLHSSPWLWRKMRCKLEDFLELLRYLFLVFFSCFVFFQLLAFVGMRRVLFVWQSQSHQRGSISWTGSIQHPARDSGSITCSKVFPAPARRTYSILDSFCACQYFISV